MHKYAEKGNKVFVTSARKHALVTLRILGMVTRDGPVRRGRTADYIAYGDQVHASPIAEGDRR
jgi:hypothetical protein